MSQQAANRYKERGNYTSRYKGVYQYGDEFRVQIRYNYKLIHIGIFKNEEDAAKAYNRKAIELFGEFALLNIIEEKGGSE